jgi:GT2 family glycosyltransferase
LELSVVIPLYNAERYIGELLDALAAQEWDSDWEVVIADNGSTDRGVAIAESFADRLPRLRIVDASSRSGSGHARNVGARVADGSSLMFLDDDDVPCDGYVAIMGEALRSHEFVCGRQEVERLNPEWTRKQRPSGQYEGPMMWNYDFLPYAAGGTLGIRRNVFESVGGFDEAVMYADCADLCWRVQLDLGVELKFVPEAVLHYRYRRSLREMFAQQRRYGLAEVGMYSRYRNRGVERIPIRRSLERWKRILRRLPSLRHRAGRAWWVTEFGNRIGRIQGSVSNRTIML